MKHIDAINAYKTIESLSPRVTGQTAYDLFKLKLKLKSIYEFQIQEDDKLIKKYNAQVTEDGRIIVADEQSADFEKDYNELRGMNADVDPIEIPIIPDITFREIEALYGFVNFV